MKENLQHKNLWKNYSIKDSFDVDRYIVKKTFLNWSQMELKKYTIQIDHKSPIILKEYLSLVDHGKKN